MLQSPTSQCRNLIIRLESACKARNISEILNLFEEVKGIDLENVDATVFEKYDALVDRANNIIIPHTR